MVFKKSYFKKKIVVTFSQIKNILWLKSFLIRLFILQDK